MSLRKKIILSICVSIIVILAITYYSGKIGIVDDIGYSIVHCFHNDIITTIFKTITMCGGGLAIFLLIDVVFLFNKKKGLYFLVNVVAILLLNLIIKEIVMRGRPEGINLILETGYSFPSGHSMVSAAAYGLIIDFLRRSKINKYLKIISIVVSLLLMIFIPISRIYLGVHYTSDVIIGFCISTIWVLFYSEILKTKLYD